MKHIERSRPSSAEIAQVAYAIWEKEGRPAGRDVQHWLQAKAEIEAKCGVFYPTIAGRTRQRGEVPLDIYLPKGLDDWKRGEILVAAGKLMKILGYQYSPELDITQPGKAERSAMTTGEARC